MVSSTSAPQVSENEKRRKQTMERAKAIHLSRQLQMRLQYARLKVEHGWQKQNLNEVENLYFHHSHLRGPKPFPAPSIIATHQHATSFVGPSTSSVQSSLSFKLATSSLGRNPSTASFFQSYDQSKNSTCNEDANAANPAQQTFSSNDYIISTNVNPHLTPDSMEVDINDAEVALTLPTPPSQSGMDRPMPLGDQINIIGLTSPPRNSKSPVEPAPTFTSPHVAVKPQRGLTQKVLPAPNAPPTQSTKDIFSSSLTYDSFWSSHTGITTPQSRQGLHSDTAMDYPPTFHNPTSTSNNIIPQPNSDRQRNFGVPA